MILRIAEILRQKGIEQKKLAEKIGIQPQNLSRMLKNDDAKVSTIINIANAIGVSPSELIEGRESSKQDINDRLLEIIEAEKREKAVLLEIMKSQRLEIEELSKKVPASTEDKLDVAK